MPKRTVEPDTNTTKKPSIPANLSQKDLLPTIFAVTENTHAITQAINERLEAFLWLLDANDRVSKNNNSGQLLNIIGIQRDIISSFMANIQVINPEDRDAILNSIMELDEWAELMKYEDALDKEDAMLATAYGDDDNEEPQA